MCVPSRKFNQLPPQYNIAWFGMFIMIIVTATCFIMDVATLMFFIMGLTIFVFMAVCVCTQ